MISGGAALALIAVLGATPASADKAKDLFEKAETQYRLGNFAQALTNYEAALKLRRHPSIIYNIAQCYRQMSKPDKALFFYKLYLSDWARDNAKPPNFSEVKRHIDQLTGMIEESKRATPTPSVAAPPARARLHLAGLPDGARVLVGGVLRARAPLAAPIELEPGEHQVRVEATGFLPWTRTVNASAGEQPRVDVTLSRPAGRSTFWLATGIATGALAVGSMALGVAFNLKANDQREGSDEYDQQRNISLAGYVVGGTLAAASVVSWILWARSGGGQQEAPRAAAAVLPTRGGAAMTGVIRF